MTTSGSRNPRAATCEDFDEDNQSTSSRSRPTANVARKRSQSSDFNIKTTNGTRVHNGSDSGYSSKAGTNESISSGRAKTTGLRINTEVMERQRQPYTHNPSRPGPTRQPSTKTKETTKETTKEKTQDRSKDKVKERTSNPPERFKHPPKTCWTCDQLGYHTEPPLPPPSYTAPAPPPSPKASRKERSKVPENSSSQTKSLPRRQSSKHETRPSMYHAPPPQYPDPSYPAYIEYTHPIVPPNYAYQTPITPNTNYPQMPYHYVPETPVSTTYPNHPGYFEPQVNHTDSHHSGHPSNGYVYPAESPLVQYGPAIPEQQLSRVPSRGSRPRINTQSHQITDTDRMPPPPRREAAPPVRPAIRTSSTDLAAKRQSVRYEDDERPDFLSKSSSRDISSHPPSSWKGAAAEASDRPFIARRTTIPTDHVDPVREKELAAEAHMNKFSNGRPVDLTAESLKRYSQKPLASDAGTHRTNQSRESTRSRRAGTTVSNSANSRISMDLGGVTVDISREFEGQPIDLRIGNISLSLNAEKNKDREEERPKEPRRIERAPSDVSQKSRKSPTKRSVGEEYPLTKEQSRKSTQTDQDRTSANSSKKSSRNPSSTRASFDQIKRPTPAEINRPEDYYGA